MRHAGDAKTKSAPKHPGHPGEPSVRAVLFLAVLVVGAGIAAGVILAFRAQPPKPQPQLPYADINGHHYTIEVASTPADRQKGLGGRATLAADHGMLFAFPTPDIECFWMKDTHFPLDMIWLDANKKVIYLQQNVQPASYPTTYCSTMPALYVIELAAGQVKQDGLQLGQNVSFSLVLKR